MLERLDFQATRYDLLCYYARHNKWCNSLSGGKPLTKQRKKGRPRSENPMVHTAVVLPRDLLERLRRDAEAREHGLSTEIRERLRVYEQDRDLEILMQRDHETKWLLEAIKLLADNLAGDLGKKWHEHPYALAAFKAGVAAFLGRYQPKGDASARPDTRMVGEPDDSPDAVGRTHARLLLRAQERLGENE
jgi:hypothetical protein